MIEKANNEKQWPEIILIGAVSLNNVVGNSKNSFGLPWPRIKTDLNWFRQKTMGEDNIGHPVLMGRHTFLSLPKTLPGRPHIVLSRGSSGQTGEVFWVKSLEDVFKIEIAHKTGKIFVIGGPETWDTCWQDANKLIITRFEDIFEGNVSYGKFSLEELTSNSSPWKITNVSDPHIDIPNSLSFRFEEWERRW